jgi:TolB protein
MMRNLITLISCLFFSLATGEELIVHLPTADQRPPLYLHFVGKEVQYARQLEEVLRVDLERGGRLQVSAQTKERRELADQESALNSYDAASWQKLGVLHVLRAQLEANALSLALFCSETGKIKNLEKMPLSGKLAEDRTLVHRIADAIHLELFGIEGIAQLRILYTSRLRGTQDPAKWVAEVWEADYDGGNAKQLTQEETLCVTPTYVPKGKGRCSAFLFVSYKIGQPKIYQGSLTGGKAKRLTFLKSNQLMPACNLFANQIAFVSDIAGNPDLFIQDFSQEAGILGKPRQIYSAPQAAQGTPAFSPDGKQIAFVSNKDGTPRIYVMPITAAEKRLGELSPQLITKKNQENTSPAWSSDGTKIAYSALTNGVRQIWVYDFDTKDETQLTEGAVHKENPAWAPDSFHLLYNSASAASAELFLINLQQKEAFQVTHGAGEKRFPAWEPQTLATKKNI